MTEEKIEQKVKQPSFYQAVGRRKSSSARVRLYVTQADEIKLNGDKGVKRGDILVNFRSISEYFPGPVNQKKYLEPFRLTNTVGRFAVSALITGGGLAGQLGAFIHAVSRALEQVNKEKFHPVLKQYDLLTRDPRAKERRKAGFAQKARARKQSPKR